jgi:hypothetical protein
MLGNVYLLAVGKSRFHQLGKASCRCKAPHQLQPCLATVLGLVIKNGGGDISESSDHGALRPSVFGSMSAPFVTRLLATALRSATVLLTTGILHGLNRRGGGRLNRWLQPHRAEGNLHEFADDLWPHLWSNLLLSWGKVTAV